MTKEQCLTKIKSMMPDIEEYIMKESERLLNSGGIDPGNYCQEFIFSAIILAVVLNNLKNRYKPLSDKCRKDIKNLSHF